MIIDRLSAAREGLRPSERKVAELILQRPLLATELSIAEAAAQAGVSEPTVMRFCRALGLNGYADLRRQLVRDLARRAPPVHRAHEAPAGDALGAAAALLAQAQTIALDCALPDLAEALARDLITAGFRLAAPAALTLHITDTAITLAHRDGQSMTLPAQAGSALTRLGGLAQSLAALIARAAPANAFALQAAREAAQAAAQRAFHTHRSSPS